MDLAELCLTALTTGELTWAAIEAIEDLLARRAYQPHELEALGILLDALQQGEVRSPLAVSTRLDAPPSLQLRSGEEIRLFFPEACPSSTSR